MHECICFCLFNFSDLTDMCSVPLLSDCPLKFAFLYSLPRSCNLLPEPLLSFHHRHLCLVLLRCYHFFSVFFLASLSNIKKLKMKQRPSHLVISNSSIIGLKTCSTREKSCLVLEIQPTTEIMHQLPL